ncbi:MAG TPA: hypothetical protein PLK86_05745, partial [Bacilli bacterium]|nr:hypothetical protein [Bacilli bacterium]
MKKPFYVLLLVFLTVFMVGSFKQTNYVLAEDGVEYTLTVNVTVPEDTPVNAVNAKVILVGSINGWNPKEGWVMTKDPDNDYLYSVTKTITLDNPTIEFKFVVGEDWAFVEKDAEGNDAANRVHTLSASEPNVINETVAKW